MKTRLITFVVVVLAFALLLAMAGHRYFRSTGSTDGTIVEVTAKNFEKEVLQSDRPVFVEFYATWCEPCKKQAPIVEEVAREYAGRVKFVKIDIDKSPDLTQQAGIQSIPAMFLLNLQTKTGLVATGFLEKEELVRFIEDGLKAKPADPNP